MSKPSPKHVHTWNPWTKAADRIRQDVPGSRRRVAVTK